MKTPTNRYGLPTPITAAVDRYAARYDKGGADISSTQLGEPPRIIALKNRHGEEIQEDYSDRLYVLDGHIVHEILENAAKEGDKRDDLEKIPLVEKRFRAMFAGWAVSGQVDHFDPATGILSDYKRVSVAQRKRGAKDEWVSALNVQAELLRRNGYIVTRLQAVRWYRDWALSAKQREADYPVCAIETVAIPLWTPEQATAWIEGRVELHKLAALVNDDAELPECTMEERWNPGSLWAVTKPGAAKALRLLPTDHDAALWMTQNAPTAKIVERPGVNRRCQLYCQVAQWCAIGQQEIRNARTTDEVAIQSA